ncbi:hypothetical protein B0H10DRAFT_2119734 [Mycena sp. CBHHK59/15]|nr:hypothetical protein B0H10DRAFT_2119734 [Mycena sp. CBHHK59/15]
MVVRVSSCFSRRFSAGFLLACFVICVPPSLPGRLRLLSRSSSEPSSSPSSSTSNSGAFDTLDPAAIPILVYSIPSPRRESPKARSLRRES